jgi:hypothetical protein
MIEEVVDERMVRRIGVGGCWRGWREQKERKETKKDIQGAAAVRVLNSRSLMGCLKSRGMRRQEQRKVGYVRTWQS